MGDAPLLSHCSLIRNPLPKPTGVLEHCREGETNCWFSTFRAFPSDSIPKATKDVGVHFFIHSSNSCKFYQRISGTFEDTAYSLPQLKRITVVHDVWFFVSWYKLSTFFFSHCTRQGNFEYSSFPYVPILQIGRFLFIYIISYIVVNDLLANMCRGHDIPSDKIVRKSLNF